MQPRVREVLVWRGNRIGDVVMTFPALKIIRSQPEVRLTYVTTEYARELMELSSLAHTVFALRYTEGIGNLWRYRTLSKLVRQNRFDRIFIYGKTDRYRRRIGPIDGVFRSEDFPTGHRSERLARAVMKGLGVEASIPGPQLDLPVDERIARRLASFGFGVREQYLVIHPGCHTVTRRSLFRRDEEPVKSWPPAKYVELISALRASHCELHIALVGTAAEREWVQEGIVSQLPSGAAVNLCGRTSLRELLQLLKRAAGFVGGDSGVMHLGSVAGTPMVALFGPTNEAHTGPYGMGGRVVVVRTMPYEEAVRCPDCMDRISVEQVGQEVERLLDAAPVRASAQIQNPRQ